MDSTKDEMAAFGLFHVAFTDLDTHIAAATFKMCRRKEPLVTFEELLRAPFQSKLKKFEQELEKFGDSHESAVRLRAENIELLRSTCGVIKGLAKWRNDRVHSRVLLTDRGYVLYGLKTQQRLEMSYAHIESKRQEAIKAICDIEAYVGELIQLTKWEAEFDQLFSGLSDSSNSNSLEEA